MATDLLIKNGHVIDTYAGVDTIQDIAVHNGKIIEAGCDSFNPELVADASGYYVFPGLIDFHAHLFEGGSSFGVTPDLLLSTGVTTAVDAGSTGCANFEVFYRLVCTNSRLRIKTFLNLSSCGQTGHGIQEQADPAIWDYDAITRLVDYYANNIIGLKLRIGRAMLGERGIRPLLDACRFSEQLGLPLSVHVTDSPLTAEEIADLLPKGSIYCHVYHGKKNIIIDRHGILPEIRKASDRGVLFDAANGKTNFDFEIAKQSMSYGFYPDIISSDITPSTLNIGRNVKNLPFIMSKYLAMGMTLHDVVRCVTETPARSMKLQCAIGTLQPGVCADITICKLADGDFVFEDSGADTFCGKKLLIPAATIRRGNVMYCQTDFTIST